MSPRSRNPPPSRTAKAGPRAAPTDESLQDAVFGALAHPARRRMLDLATLEPGLTIAALSKHFEMSAVGVLKHVRVLESAQLLLTHRHGRERLLYVNLVPIQCIYDRWTDVYGSFWARRVADLKDRIESESTRKVAQSA